MDWELISQQLMRHVHDKLPRAFIRESAQADSDNIIGDFAQQIRPPDSILDSISSKGPEQWVKESVNSYLTPCSESFESSMGFPKNHRREVEGPIFAGGNDQTFYCSRIVFTDDSIDTPWINVRLIMTYE